MFDPITEHLLSEIESLGYRIGIVSDEAAHQFSAEHRETGERFVVTGDSPYAVAFELAKQVGMEIEGA